MTGMERLKNVDVSMAELTRKVEERKVPYSS